MAITINGSGITSSEIADGTITNADINASAGIVGSKINGSFGKVLQVVQATDNNNVSPQQPQLGVVGLKFINANITPTSATSKILCLVEAAIEASSGNYNSLQFEMRRDSAILKTVVLIGYRGNAQTHVIMTRNWAYLDSPTTTSNLEYSGWIANSAGSGFGSSTYAGRANGYGTSYITLIEVEG